MSIITLFFNKIKKTFFSKESFTNFIYGYTVKVEQEKPKIEKKLVKPYSIKQTPKPLKTNKKVIQQGEERKLILLNQYKESLEKAIKKNIFYLIQLRVAFVKNNVNAIHIKKINDLIWQSEGNINIMYKLKIEAIYYRSTLDMIKNHTKIIQELIKESIV